MTKILVTGGAGYIGSHVVKKLGEQGCECVIYDNFSTGHDWAVLYGNIIRGDIRDENMLERVFLHQKFDIILHFAASIIVPESLENPIKYYSNNVQGTLNLLSAMFRHGVNRIVFSSTAAVYGMPASVPVKEDAPIAPISPYGQGKAFVEKVLQDMAKAAQINYVALRYFNVAGADPAGRIGEGKENPSHLIARCLRAAAGSIPGLSVFGADYPTPDGTCIRDYLHVDDLAAAHLQAMNYLLKGGASDTFNCGYNRGYSVLDVVRAAKEVTGVNFPVIYTERRDGDPPIVVADSTKIRQVLGWKPVYDDLKAIIQTAWDWELIRPRQDHGECI